MEREFSTMAEKQEAEPALSFELTKEQVAALKQIAGGKGIRISGCVDGNKVKVDTVAINAGIVGVSSNPFDEKMAPFIACNGPMRGD
jgi:hypothetical protein